MKLVYRYRSFKSDSMRPDHLNASHTDFHQKKFISSNANTPTTNKIPEIAMNWL